MPAERVSMRQAREIIRLKFSTSLATREIARRLGLAPSTVRETLSCLESAGLSWPLPEGIGDAILDRLVHNAHRIELAGESLRRTQAKQSRKA